MPDYFRWYKDAILSFIAYVDVWEANNKYYAESYIHLNIIKLESGKADTQMEQKGMKLGIRVMLGKCSMNAVPSLRHIPMEHWMTCSELSDLGWSVQLPERVQCE